MSSFSICFAEDPVLYGQARDEPERRKGMELTRKCCARESGPKSMSLANLRMLCLLRMGYRDQESLSHRNTGLSWRLSWIHEVSREIAASQQPAQHSILDLLWTEHPTIQLGSVAERVVFYTWREAKELSSVVLNRDGSHTKKSTRQSAARCDSE